MPSKSKDSSHEESKRRGPMDNAPYSQSEADLLRWLQRPRPVTGGGTVPE